MKSFLNRFMLIASILLITSLEANDHCPAKGMLKDFETRFSNTYGREEI